MENKTIILMQNAKRFRQSKGDQGLLYSQIAEIVNTLQDHPIDLVSTVYNIAYRRGYNRAKRDLRNRKQTYKRGE